MSDLILYTTEDGKSQIQLRTKDQTVWLSQREMAQLFDVSTDNVGLHLKNIYEDGELRREATAEESSVVQTEGGREVRRPVTLYNLDAILAVGYRVRSPRGVQFRRWASTVLKEYLLKGFALDDERLKNPDGRPDYFDEMLARIRDIRASEKRFYQKVRDLFALSSDYDKTDHTTLEFFAIVQNMLLYAVTQKTAAEIITARANPNDPHFGLLAWKGDKVRNDRQNQKQLGKTLWNIADQLRGAMNADDFRDYMLSFLFLRYLSDNYEAAAKKELGRGLSQTGRRRPPRAAGRLVCQQPRKTWRVREADAPQGALRHQAGSPLGQHRQPGPHAERRLLNTLQDGSSTSKTSPSRAPSRACSPRSTSARTSSARSTPTQRQALRSSRRSPRAGADSPPTSTRSATPTNT
jgi:hypothetical protein